MQITMLTTGSRGDTQPFIALGVALRKAGCSVRIAASRTFTSLIEEHGLDPFVMSADVAAIAGSDLAKEMRQANNPLKFFRSFHQPELQRLGVQMQAEFWEAAQGSDALVYHPGAAVGYFIARRLGIPGILGTPFPMTATSAYPALLFYNRRPWGGLYNRLTHQIFEKGFWLAVRGSVNQFWQQEFGEPPADFGAPFARHKKRRYPTLVSGSEHVFPAPADWPAHVHNTGYWFLDEGPWQPPAELQAFLEAGEPPVYVGFGSIGDKKEKVALTRLVVDGVQRTGRRGVLATGWQGLAVGEDLPAEIFVLPQAPHAWLFPRMAAVVHHGGAGTTAAGLRAGVPAVVVPHGNDQFAWGQRVHELGAGAAYIPRKELTAARLAAAIDQALQPDVHAAAAALGEKIRQENGAERAATIIMETVRSSVPA